jgi:hypothetical protein
MTCAAPIEFAVRAANGAGLPQAISGPAPILHARTDRPVSEKERLDLVLRAWELRKARKIGIVLADQGRMYLCESEVDPWGTARYLSWPRFREMVEGVEREMEVPARKPVKVEQELHRWQPLNRVCQRL